jgi:hypothetical protein
MSLTSQTPDKRRSLQADNLHKDRRGVALVEFAIAMVPVFIFFFGSMQMGVIAYMHLIVKHSAYVAARCAAVQNPGGVGNWGTDAGPVSDIKQSVWQLFSYPNTVPGVQQGDFAVQTTLAAPTYQGAQLDQVAVTLTYKCTVPLGDVIACGTSKTIPITAVAQFPNQGSVYQNIWTGN